MRIEGFVTSYKDNDGKLHIYFFPGKDENGHILCKMLFLTKDVDYLYTRQADGGIDYIIIDSPSSVIYRMTEIATGQTYTYNTTL